MLYQKVNAKNKSKGEFSKGFVIGFLSILTIGFLGIYLLKKSKENNQ